MYMMMQYTYLLKIVCPPRLRVLDGVLGKSLTLGGEEWEGKMGYAIYIPWALGVSVFFLLFSPS